MSLSPWFLTRASGQPRLRLFCFSYAGGNANAYLRWQAKLDPAIEIVAAQLPGRGARLREPPLTSFTTILEQLALHMQGVTHLPCVFFGHSLGALVAFELARYCAARGLAMPRALLVSGCDAPQCRAPIRDLHDLDDDALIATLAQYNGTPPELLQHRELMSMLAPAIRADFALAAHYHYQPGPLLDLPITVLSGRADVNLNLDHISEWRRETTGACELKWFDGDHFFIHSSEAALLTFLNSELLAWQRGEMAK